MIPLIDLRKQNGAIEAELKAAFERVLTSGYYILGPENDAFEKSLADFCEISGALTVSSGTDAILLALMALGIGPGDEVLCPTYTFFATAGCVARTGATPVFVDACPVSFNIDLEDAKMKVGPKTKAIIPVHLFGQAADMDAVTALTKEHGLFVIEDAAQALGARYKGKMVGSFGDFGTFSFFPTKNLGCLGDGGALISKDPGLLAKAKLLRNHGAEPKYFHQVIGGNFRLDSLQSAFLDIKLKHYGEYTRGRQKNAAYYTEALSQLPGVKVNNSLEVAKAPEKHGVKLLLPHALEDRVHIWNQYTLRVIDEGQRDALKKHLADKGIASETYYPCTMDAQACFKNIGRGKETIKVAHELSQEALSIPIASELKEEELKEVVEAIAEFLK